MGDSLTNDVAGAQGAGVRPVWLNRDGRENATGVQPDFEITSLTELLGICNALPIGRASYSPLALPHGQASDACKRAGET